MHGRSHGRGNLRTRALLYGLALAVGFLALGAGQASADSVTLSVTTTTGQSDPAAGVGRVFTLSGTSAVETRVWVKYRAPGGAACAPSADTDTGETLFEYGTNYFDGRTVNGAFSIARADTWPTPGTYVFCFWLSRASNTVSTPFTQAITFRAPTGTITATVNPITPQINQTATINVTGASEAPAYVFAKLRPGGGAACAPSYSADTGDELIDGQEVNGAFSLNATTTKETAGTYLICLWLAKSSNDATPIAGPQPQTFTVQAPRVEPVRERIAVTSTLRRRGSRYSGRIRTRTDCINRRTVVLRRVGSGKKSFGRARTRSNGTFTIQRGRRLRGRVYVVVASRGQGLVTCISGRSRKIRG